MTRVEKACGRLLARVMPVDKAPGVAISFDDAYVNEWHGLRDLLNKHAAKVTFFVSDFDLLPAESVEKLRILQSDGHEIAFHGLRHLSAGKFIAEHSLDKYLQTEIFPGIGAMMRCGFSPATFSYPYGVRSQQIDGALLKYFKHVRGVVCTNSKKRLADFRQIYYKHDKGLVFAAGIDNVYGNKVEEIRDAMKKAADGKKTLLLYAHRISDEAGDYCTPASRMEALLEYASKVGLTFYRMKDL